MLVRVTDANDLAEGELRVCFPAVFGSRPARRPGPSPEPDADHDAWNDPSDESRR